MKVVESTIYYGYVCKYTKTEKKEKKERRKDRVWAIYKNTDAPRMLSNPTCK